MAPTDTMARHLADIERDDYTVLESILAPHEADDLAAELERLEHDLGITDGRTTFTGRRSRRVHNLIGRSAALRSLATHPVTLPFVDELLGPDALLTIMVSLNLGPGQPAQVLHCDEGIYPIQRPRPRMDLQVLWALTDFTEANGATRLVPGSHRFDHEPAQHNGEIATIAAAAPTGLSLRSGPALTGDRVSHPACSCPRRPSSPAA